jgi:hypothetical protein
LQTEIAETPAIREGLKGPSYRQETIDANEEHGNSIGCGRSVVGWKMGEEGEEEKRVGRCGAL